MSHTCMCKHICLSICVASNHDTMPCMYLHIHKMYVYRPLCILTHKSIHLGIQKLNFHLHHLFFIYALILNWHIWLYICFVKAVFHLPKLVLTLRIVFAINLIIIEFWAQLLIQLAKIKIIHLVIHRYWIGTKVIIY